MSFEDPQNERPAGPEGDAYPDAISRKHGEGGYAFLKRALRQALETGMPVVINTGRNYLQYEFKDDQRSFWDGVTVLEDVDDGALDTFRGTAENYMVEQGLTELRDADK